ncbi:MAG: flagellar hook-length control protein FliK [Campylobacterales bacterium]|nr:flagellar hook-length control protein FliK [Campylobacterales bacterium]
MISLDIKTKNSSSSPISLVTKEDKSKLSFSELLKGISTKKETQSIQNGALVLSLSSEEKDINSTKSSTKTETLASLLKNKNVQMAESKVELKEASVPFELNPKITSTLSKEEFRILVKDAKEYLKSKIIESDDYKKSEIKELPKTLKGLAEVGKKFGINISKITIEDVRPEVKTNKPDATSILRTAKESPSQEIQPAKAVIKEPLKEALKTETLNTKTAVKESATAEVPLPKTAVKESATVEIPLPKTAVKETPKESTAAEVPQTKEIIAEAFDIKEKKVKAPQTKELKAEIKNDNDVAQSDKIVTIEEPKTKVAPLLKTLAPAEHTTEQLVQAKSGGTLKVEEKITKNRADETLKSLLSGEKPTQSLSALAGNISVSAARIVESSNPTESKSQSENSFEKLLVGDTESKVDSSQNTKLDGLSVHKADSLEVKINEAKQMIKYLSADVKTVIEDYKAPFTRVKVQLNPEKFGDVELTVVQRGSNLHVNISSNSTAINTLSANIMELKTQLNNSGINNATLNFSNSSDNSASSQQQGQKQQQNEAHKEYNYFENDEKNEEILSSLEIIVPRYI